MRNFPILLAVALALAAALSAQAALTLPDGTVTADRQDSSTGSSQWFGETLTTLTIDAENLASGAYVKVSGKITGISNISSSWVEVGLVPKDRWDYWQTAYSGNFKAATFNKGLYVVHWVETGGTGLALQEGWDDWSSTTYTTSGREPYAWGLSAPSVADPWSFSFSMHPPAPGEAYLDVEGETIYGTQPLEYGIGGSDNDFSECYLTARIWSTVENATFSFADVQAAVIPEPGSVIVWGLLGGLAFVGTCLVRRRVKA